MLMGALLARVGWASLAPPGGDFPARRTITTHLRALGALGAAGKAYEYLQAMAGWARGLLAVAGLAGIVKSR